MSDRDKHIAYLFTAELQFRLASAVRLATARGVQTLDFPMVWTHGRHQVKYEEVALRTDQADFAAHFLQNSATYLMAVTIKDAIKAIINNPKNSDDVRVRAAYQIARLIRNAFAHGPFAPTWSVDKDCADTVFEVKGIIKLNTTGLHGVAFDWRHYGGPLALFRLCRFVRITLLKDSPTARKSIPLSTTRIYQIGNLILTKVDSIPVGAKRVEVKALADGSIPLGDGYFIRPFSEKT